MEEEFFHNVVKLISPIIKKKKGTRHYQYLWNFGQCSWWWLIKYLLYLKNLTFADRSDVSLKCTWCVSMSSDIWSVRLREAQEPFRKDTSCLQGLNVGIFTAHCVMHTLQELTLPDGWQLYGLPKVLLRIRHILRVAKSWESEMLRLTFFFLEKRNSYEIFSTFGMLLSIDC